MDKAFKKGEVVWAKVRGYSWWPGIVKKISLKLSKAENSKSGGAAKEVRILVKFIGDNSHSVLPLEKIEKFEKKFSQFSKTKKKPLLFSIKLARKFINGEIGLVELKKIRSRNNNSKESDCDGNASGSDSLQEDGEEDVIKGNNTDEEVNCLFFIYFFIFFHLIV